MPAEPRNAPARAGLRTDVLGESWAERRGPGTVTVRQVTVAEEVAVVAERELRAASKLSHTAILRPLEIGRRPGALQIVNARSPGPTLRQMLEAHAGGKSRFEPSQATWIALRVLDALAFAHEYKDEAGANAPVAHGRISPEHIVVTRQGEVLLTGFGLDTLARAAASDTAKPDPAFSYLAPEQCGGAPAQPSSDIFAVGCILAELLVGEPVFFRATLADTREAVTNHLPDAFRSKRAEIPKALDEAILFALEKAVDRRAKAAELSKKLGAFMGMMEVADRIKPDQHPARLSDFIRIRMRDLVDPLDPASGPAKPVAKKRGTGAFGRWVRRIFRVAAVASLAALGIAVWARWPELEPELMRLELVQRVLGTSTPAPPPAAPATAPVLAAAPATPATPPEPVTVPASPDSGAAAVSPEPAAPAAAHLDIESTPPSTVFLDGTRLGQTPLKGVEVSPGEHRVEFLGAKAKKKQLQKVKVAAGETRRVRVKLPKR